MCDVNRSGCVEEQLSSVQDKVDHQDEQIDDILSRLKALEKKKSK